jgi:hypothetical protein
MTTAISHKNFSFVIVGTRWDAEVNSLIASGFEVVYHPRFENVIYEKALK